MLSLSRAWMALIAVGIYVLAYRHGKTIAAATQPCDCSRARAREDEELLDMIPHTERVMVSCMLEKEDTRSVLRNRLRTCLFNKGMLDPSSAAELMSSLPPPPPPASATSGVAVLAPRQMSVETVSAEHEAPPQPESPLQREMLASREVCASMA